MKLQLNFNKPDNYAFYCPVSRIHLTRSNPVGFVDEVTPYIKRGLKSKAIIEVSDNGQNAEPIKAEPVAPEVTEPVEEVVEVEPVEETVKEVVEEPVEETVEEPVEEKASKPKRKKKA